MRALLVNPWIYDFAAYDLWSKPLGLLNIGACLEKAGADVILIDCLDRFQPRLRKFLNAKLPKSSKYGCGRYHSEEIKKPSVFKSIPRRFKRYGMPVELFETLLEEIPRPDIILVTSGMTYWYPAAFDAIKILRKHFDRVPIILGGIYARICYSHAKKNSGADFVYKGNDIFEISKLIGVGIKERTAIFPAYDLYPQLHYVTLRASSGCPFRCSYCGWYRLESAFRQEDPEFIANRITHFNKKRKIHNFAFYDDALLYNARGHIIKILEKILSDGVKANFHTPNGLHARYITPILADILRRSGFIQPRLGLETSSSKRQKDTGRKVTNNEFTKAVKYLKDAGYRPEEIGANILIGLPGQTYEEIKKSIEFAHSNCVRIFLEEYSPIPKTPDYTKSGLPADVDPLMHNNSIFPLYRPDDHFKFQELKDLARGLNNSV